MISYWHTRRMITRIGRLINSQAVIRTPMNVRKHYHSGLLRPITGFSENYFSLAFVNKDKIANIWERGFKSYNYGKRVLGNPALDRVLTGRNGRYIRMPVGKGANKVWRTISEKGLREKPGSWIMPKLDPTEAYKRAYGANKDTVKKMLSESVKKDILNALKG